MANGDAVSTDTAVGVYISDEGHTYLRKVKHVYLIQAALGWDVATSAQIISQDYAPRGLDPRSWLVWDAADHSKRRRIIVATNADYVAGVVGTTTVVVPFNGAELTMTLYAMEGERKRGKITDQAHAGIA